MPVSSPTIALLSGAVNQACWVFGLLPTYKTCSDQSDTQQKPAGGFMASPYCLILLIE